MTILSRAEKVNYVKRWNRFSRKQIIQINVNVVATYWPLFSISVISLFTFLNREYFPTSFFGNDVRTMRIQLKKKGVLGGLTEIDNPKFKRDG